MALRSPRLAAAIAREDDVLETAQVLLLGTAGLACLGKAARLPRDRRAPFVLAIAFLGLGIARETDLELDLFGRRVVHARVFRGAEDAWLTAALLGAGLLLLGLLGAYALRHREAFLSLARTAARSPSGALFSAGGVLALLVQAVEGRLNRFPFPAFFLEEALELLADVLLVGGVLALPGGYDTEMPDRGDR